MDHYKLFRFESKEDSKIRILAQLPEQEGLVDLTAAGLSSITELLESGDRLGRLTALSRAGTPVLDPSKLRCLTPVETQEVWAAGVTYYRSKKARMEESDFSADAYDRVYEAERPELFFKSLPSKVVGSDALVGIRKDARWNVPEPELALVFNSRGEWVGCSIGNDMSSRDIEGENLLYLPQAKVYAKSCAIGPCVTLISDEQQVREWDIRLTICRGEKEVFKGDTSVGQIKRSFEELTDFLWRSQEFPNGVVLLTGTGVVPAEDFTLQPGDRIGITISGIGSLSNQVEVV